MRIRQELLLGVGGVRALKALGISPGVVHLNEGHSAFAALELVRQRMITEGIDADEAIRRVAAQVVFTTHTPVPAGHDRFSPDLVEEHLGPLREALGLDAQRCSRSAARMPANDHETFCMTVLALKLSRRANAVSSLHGQVSRAMWAPLYSRRTGYGPGSGEERVPIGHITNGVHVAAGSRRRCTRSTTVTSDRTGPSAAPSPSCWDDIEQIDDGELWETHQTLKTRLIDFARRRTARAAERRGEPAETSRS